MGKRSSKACSRRRRVVVAQCYCFEGLTGLKECGELYIVQLVDDVTNGAQATCEEEGQLLLNYRAAIDSVEGAIGRLRKQEKE